MRKMADDKEMYLTMVRETEKVIRILIYSNLQKSCGKRKRGRGLQGKAEDAGGLTSVKGDCAAVGSSAALWMRRPPCGGNAAMRFPDR